MKKMQLDEFFSHLKTEYDAWKRNDDGRCPQVFDLSNELSGTVYSYSGYAHTDVVRKNFLKDIVVKEMLERSLDVPSIIVDAGTFNGVRLQRILDSLNRRARSNIRAIYGVDVNAAALTQAEATFDHQTFPFFTYHGRIEQMNIAGLGKGRKIVLGLENIFLNILGTRKTDTDGMHRLISRMLKYGDVSIFETHKTIDEDAYPQHITTFLQEYFIESGIQKKLGGRLDAVFTDQGKFTYIRDLPTHIVYDGNAFDFETRALYHDGNQGIPFIADPAICIATSRILTDMPEFLIESAAEGIESPHKEDIKQLGTELIFRMQRNHGRKYLRELAERSRPWNFEPAPLVDTIRHQGAHPKHYLQWL